MIDMKMFEKAEKKNLKIIDTVAMFLIIVAFCLDFYRYSVMILKEEYLKPLYYTSNNMLPYSENIKIQEMSGKYMAVYKNILPLGYVNIQNVERPTVKLGKNCILLKGTQNYFYVTDFFDNSPAEKAGIQADDIIFSVNDVVLDGTNTITDLLAADEDGYVKIGVLRNDVELEINLWLNEEKMLGVYGTYNTLSLGTISFVFGNDNYFFALGHSTENINVVGEPIAQIEANVNEDNIFEITKVLSENFGEVLYVDEYGLVGSVGEDWLYGNEIELAWDWEIEKNAEVNILVSTSGGTRVIKGIITKQYDNLRTENGEKSIIDYEYKVMTQDETKFVSGMSGSPVLQNGRLIGVMSAVNVEAETMGYIVTSENIYKMLESEECKEALDYAYSI